MSMANEVTHVLQWIPPELIRTRKWFGRMTGDAAWELQPLEAWEAGRHGSDDDYTWLPDLESRHALVADLTAAVSGVLGYAVTLKEEPGLSGVGIPVIPGWNHRPLRWVDAPAYAVTLAGGGR